MDCSTASIFNLILLSLDRYWAVVYPLLYLQNRSRKRAISLIVIIWFISFLWAPAIIFWSFLIPQHSDILKPSECDTAFRANKLFKTLTALVNFYLPLLTMIVISCRIMVAIRSRSKMEYGRRISSTTRNRMRKERTYTNASITHGNPEKILSMDGTNEQTMSPTTIIAINPFEYPIENSNNSIDQSSEDDRICSESKAMRILFPSLTSIKETNKRKSEVLPRRYSLVKKLPNSFSVSNDMKYSAPSNIPIRQKSLTEFSSSSSSNECSHSTVLRQTSNEQSTTKVKKQLSM